MPRSVVIAGAGQLGSRYLQGLAGVDEPLLIHVLDVSAATLERAEARWREVAITGGTKQVAFSVTADGIPKMADVAIVATAADARPDVVGMLSRTASVRFWVLEKVLAQSQEGVSQIETFVGPSEGAWVNTPRRLMPWHQSIRDGIGSLDGPVQLTVMGGSWGLACNAVHFLDLVQWWTGEALDRIETGGLRRQWLMAKRSGYWEVMGTMVAGFAGGSMARLTVSEGDEPVRLVVRSGNREWTIAESEGTASCSDGQTISGQMLRQSDLTSGLVEGLLLDGRCGLPTLQNSAALHRVYLRDLLAHWNASTGVTASAVPIT